MGRLSIEKQSVITADLVRHRLSYDGATGIFTWKNPASRAVKSGERAGYVMGHGYRLIVVERRGYMEHRLAWLYTHGVWPDGQIDHINGQRSDNRIGNLRVASNSQNQANSARSKRNKSGVKGVSWHAKRKKWVAEIRVNTKGKHLGYFDKIEDAASAYAAAAREIRGEFARLG